MNIAAGLFFLTALQVGPAPEQGVGIYTGAVLVSSDEALRKSFGLQLSQIKVKGDLLRLFPASRFDTEELRKEELIVIDKLSGPLKVHGEREKLCNSLAKHLSPEFTLKLSDLSAEEKQALVNLGGGRIDRNSGRSVLPSTLGLFAAVGVSVKLGSGECKIDIPLRSQEIFSATEDIKKKELAAPGVSGAKPVLGPERDIVDHLDFYAVGTCHREFAACLEPVAKSVVQFWARARMKEHELAKNLFGLLGLSGNSIGEAELSASELPKSTMDLIQQQLEGSYKALGFNSPQEAREALGSARSFKLSSIIGLYECLSPGDRSKGQPARGWAFSILNVPGAVPP